MRNLFLKSFFAALLATVAVWRFFQIGPREPNYQKKPLTFWVKQLDQSWLYPGAPSRTAAETAIRSIGTNALPILLKWTAANDSALKKKVMRWAKKQSLIKFRFHSDEEYHVQADGGFAALRSLGKPAVPELIKLLSHSDTRVRVAAEFDLMWIGPEAQEAVPALVRCLNGTNGIVRFRATRCLRDIHMQPGVAVPALVQSLGRPGVPVQETIVALAQFGENAKPALPQLADLLDSKDPRTRLAASYALQVIEHGVSVRPRVWVDGQSLLQPSVRLDKLPLAPGSE